MAVVTTSNVASTDYHLVMGGVDVKAIPGVQIVNLTLTEVPTDHTYFSAGNGGNQMAAAMSQANTLELELLIDHPDPESVLDILEGIPSADPVPVVCNPFLDNGGTPTPSGRNYQFDVALRVWSLPVTTQNTARTITQTLNIRGAITKLDA